MTNQNLFDELIQSLARHWNISATTPIRDTTSRFTCGNGSTILLRLQDDEGLVTLGMERPFPCKANDAANTREMASFLLRRNHASRLGSHTCYGWSLQSGKISAFQSLPLAEIDADSVRVRLHEMTIRLNAMADIATLPGLKTNSMSLAAGEEIHHV